MAEDGQGKNYEVDLEQIRKNVLTKIQEDKMAPYYEIICDRLKWSIDADLLAELKAANEEETKKYDDEQEEAEKNAGETEVLDILFARAHFYARIGSKSKAYEALDVIEVRPKVSAGKKLDAVMTKTRVAFFFNDLVMVKRCLERAKELGELGGDWDRLNRLKVYRAFYALLVRDFKQAASLLLDCVATFTCTELCTYQEFIFYAALTNLLLLPRQQLKKQIVDGPEVLSVIREMPELGKLVNSLYECDYRSYFEALVSLTPAFQKDRLLGTHVRYLIRELRLLAYNQFLEAYKSVILASMATSFGVSVPFMDAELSRFIAAGRLNAKIDKVEGIVETNLPDKKNSQYQILIKQGDLLLNRVQRLTRIIDV